MCLFNDRDMNLCRMGKWPAIRCLWLGLTTEQGHPKIYVAGGLPWQLAGKSNGLMVWGWPPCLFSAGVLSTHRHSSICYLQPGGTAWFFPGKPGFVFCGCLGNPEFLKIQKGHFRKKWWEGEWLSYQPRGRGLYLFLWSEVFSGWFSLCVWREAGLGMDILNACFLNTHKWHQLFVSSLEQSGRSLSVSGDVLQGHSQRVGDWCKLLKERGDAKGNCLRTALQ